jgi:hypothetical protein
LLNKQKQKRTIISLIQKQQKENTDNGTSINNYKTYLYSSI